MFGSIFHSADNFSLLLVVFRAHLSHQVNNYVHYSCVCVVPYGSMFILPSNQNTRMEKNTGFKNITRVINYSEFSRCILIRIG